MTITLSGGDDVNLTLCEVEVYGELALITTAISNIAVFLYKICFGIVSDEKCIIFKLCSLLMSVYLKRRCKKVHPELKMT